MAGGRLQTNVNLSEPVANSILVTARSVVRTVYVQKVTYSPNDFVANTVLNFIDSITGQSIGQITVVAGVSQYYLDFGYNGTPLTVGANLVLAILSGGTTGRLQVNAYQLPLMVATTYVAPHTAGFTA